VITKQGKKMAKKTEFRQPPGPKWAVYCTGNIARTGHSKAQQYKKRYPGTEWIVRREEGGYTVFGRWVG
jgi:hypothetical protein